MRKAITVAAATVRCTTTATANVGDRLKQAYKHEKTRRYDAVSIPVFTRIYKLIIPSGAVCVLNVMTLKMLFLSA